MKKILFIQFREDTDLKHELTCTFKKMQKRGVQLDSFNAVRKIPKLSEVKKYNAIILGGSGPFFVSKKNYPLQEKMFTFLREVHNAQIPILGICFGLHLLAGAFGGRVAHRPKEMEIGTYLMRLNERGKKNPLFKHLPGKFLAQEGHKDKVVRLPKDAINLAGSSKCYYQAFQIKGSSTYAVQFHPELSGDELKDRFVVFKGIYSGNEREYERTLLRIRPAKQAEKVIQNFVNLI